MRRILLAFVVTLTFTSCNIIFSPAPDLRVEDSGLGIHEMRPTFIWHVKGVDLVRSFRVKIENPDGSGEWIDLPSEIHSYRSSRFLDSGTYTFRLESQSATGLWSPETSVEVTVDAVDRFDPNDPYFAAPSDYDPYDGNPVQWNLEEIHLPRLWGLLRSFTTDGMKRDDVVVAVVDTGYTLHPEITGSMDIASGYDFISPDPNSTDPFYYARDGDGLDADARDEGDLADGIASSWHGTTVASVIAATTDNNEGVAGIAVPDETTGNTHITHVPVRVLGISGGTTYDIGQGIAYAAGLSDFLVDFTGQLPEKRAKVINLSLGAAMPNDPDVDPILKAAAEAGVVLIAAAGNERGEGAVDTTYPANSPYVLSVGAVTIEGKISDYSNPGTFEDESGAPTLDLVAPGGGPPYFLPPNAQSTISWYEYIVTACPDPAATQPIADDEYEYHGSAGTSLAAPEVSGILALLATVDATHLTLDTARYVLKHSVQDLGPTGWDADFGFGLLDAVDAFAVYQQVLADDSIVTPSRTSTMNTAMRMSKPDIPPDGEIESSTLIVEFRSATDTRIVEATGIVGMRVRPGKSGTRRLVTLDAGSNVEEERNRLLERDDVKAVFYNYRYHRL